MGKGFYWKLALQNLKNNRRVYLPYLLSAIGITMMYYIMNALSLSIDEKAMYGGASVASMMALGVHVIGLFAVLFLFYTNSFIMKRRKKELGLYNILGMEKFHIAKVIFRETLITAAAAILLGLGLGILFSKAMFLLLGKILGVEIHIASLIPLWAVLKTIGLFFVIFFAAMIYNILQVRLSKPIELLHGGDVGEKEPKAHWLVAILGALCLGAGYWLAVTIQSPLEAFTFFFVAVILVIFGTYLLFITGITALLKLLKKNKKFYYKANHFTTVSGMLYRMKQNAAGLASICILFTCLLVTVSTTFSLYTGMDGLIRTRYPRNIMISGRDANEAAKDGIRSVVAEECEKAGFEPKNVLDRTYWSLFAARIDNTFTVGEALSTHFATIEIYTQEEFRRFSGQEIALAENEVLFSDPRGVFPETDSLFIEDLEYALRKTEYDFADGDAAAMIYETYFMVIPDEAAMEKITQAVEGTGEEGQALPASYSYDFDIDGSGKDIAALSRALEERWSAGVMAEGAGYESLSVENSASSREDFLSLYGGLFFLGMFLGFLFLLGTALIIYYKQVSEGYEDARRFTIMQQVGMSHREVKKSIHSQILTVFFLPLLTAILHLAFAFPMLQKIMALLNMVDFQLILYSTIGCVLVFGVIYAVIYLITAKVYYKIVETAAD